ncbi:nucleotidyltransferase family protein [Phenylobacterium parvum]|uniref:Molybdopterin-guanine dinucleotide biosynthesis protein A n=1 Tax=Phenylobacterium parvum TaxID=2201350 RepID=A0A2Z3HQR7_9CAUL|nr:nucleotidyltransferase family protein [Phenylobacterium parvum]AWM76446.1 molybdopterin-guanine dinucleotide biosynthesis protein A [Phenylobacterium parvum]
MTGAEVGLGSGYASILLAAGAGRRFGGGKLLAPWRGAPLVAGAVQAALSTPSDPVIVVTGTDPGPVGDACRAAAERMDGAKRLRLVHAPDHAEGMGASLRAGVAALPPGMRGVFVFLGDMPDIPEEIFAPLMAAVEAGAPAAAPTFRGRRGHPVLFSAALLPDLARASGDAGAREVLASLDAGLARVESPDPGVLFDVDRPEDLGDPRRG